jgi:hypothetical protein
LKKSLKNSSNALKASRRAGNPFMAILLWLRDRRAPARRTLG